ncbi:MAG TPA: phosphopantetheine-binding protein [Nitrospirota bacterium]|nr:phosphopantetheine-binding protein [Nitrospirota bacterium]
MRGLALPSISSSDRATRGKSPKATFQRIKKIVLEKIDIQLDMLTPYATLEGRGLDSLDKIELMFSLEEEFKIKIPDRQVTTVTIQDVMNVIDKLAVEQHEAG